MTHGKTYNKSPRRINHKATKRKTNTGTTALELESDFDKNLTEFHQISLKILQNLTDFCQQLMGYMVLCNVDVPSYFLKDQRKLPVLHARIRNVINILIKE